MDEVNCLLLNGNYFFLEDKYRISIFHEILLKWAEQYYDGNSTGFMFQIFFDQCFKEVAVILHFIIILIILSIFFFFIFF